MRIVVASGKGGTGKTLVSTSLALHWARQGQESCYIDADVEEPNGHLFLQPAIDATRRFTMPVPRLEGTCEACGRCQELCAFHAILAIKGRVLVFPELCHSCGACVLACLPGVLHLAPREIGTIREGRVGSLRFIDGTLDVGEARAARLTEGVASTPCGGRVIVDAPPGTSCPAVATLRGADIAVLVTEPTPFGLHDLGLAIRMCRSLGVPPVVVVNRSDLGGDVEAALAEFGAPVVGRIPFDPRIAVATAKGEIAIDVVPRFAETVAGIALAVERAALEARS
jgi:MinD superfamily P-loop ATPase